MKIRTGFVSNSSSSSFMAIVSSSTIKDINPTPLQQEILDFCCFDGYTENDEINVFEYISGEGGMLTENVKEIIEWALAKDINDLELMEALREEEYDIFHDAVNNLKQKFTDLMAENKCLVIKKYY